jgi:[protein-PII] uridylyltransferase
VGLGFAVGIRSARWTISRGSNSTTPSFLLALLDGRAVAGDASLLDRIAARVHSPAAHARILDALKRLIDERHARFNDTFYQVEPDIKDAPGALRDLWAAHAIAGLTDPGLVDRGPADRARLDEAEEFLLRLRSILHLAHKRNNNVLSHELQERAAQLMGYAGAPRQQVERLMGDYFRHARAISRSLAWVRQKRTRAGGRQRRPVARRHSIRRHRSRRHAS